MYGNGLFNGAVQLPGLLGDPGPVNSVRRAIAPNLAPVAARTSAPAPAPAGPSRLSRFGSALGQVFGGQFDPRLSDEQNKAAQRQALMQAGLATIAASGPSFVPQSLAQILAQGAMAGQQAGAGARGQKAYQAALQNPALLEGLTPSQIALLQALPPEQAAEFLSKIMTAKAGDPKVVGAGGALVSPDGSVLYTNPRPEGDLPGDLRAVLWASGVDPDRMTPEQRSRILDRYQQLAKSRASQVNIDTQPKQEQKGLTAIDIDQYEGITKDATLAESRLNSLAVMEGLLNDGMQTSKFDALLHPLRNYAAGVGLANAENAGQQELFRGLANKIALEMKGGLTGHMSDRDIIFLQNQAPQLGNTVEGNRLIIEVLRRVAQRQIELADEADKFYQQNGTMTGWRAHRRAWAKANPIDITDLRAGFQAAPWEGKK